MKSLKLFLSIFTVVLIFSNNGFADGREELVKRIKDFKKEFRQIVSAHLSWGVQVDGPAMLYITEHVVADHGIGIQEELIPFITPLREEFSAKEDTLSLLILAAMCLEYVPYESRDLILRYVMILQAALYEKLIEHPSQKENLFNLVEEQFETMDSGLRSVILEEAQAVFNSVSQDHYASNSYSSEQDTSFNILTPPLTLLAAFTTNWAMGSPKPQ
ncbi:hypothetical protein [Endozoicomonas sp. 8E]|uniref:hypothetical protein n=1 Tax=Endozoicomonas sp. 8E TaxID=3035692 RepID=UPI002938E156|nr:hypothetical protein [Endozoicomonas sp. 8E]WOG29786.1 hypothetical protein P6910_09050 [Endozoicomonas sp. 8E]